MGGRNLRTLVLIAAAISAAAVVGVVAATASSTAPAKWIVFAAVPSGQHVNQLFRIRSSGSGLKPLTKGQYSSIAPAFSPNGARIVFARTAVGLLTMDVNGRSVRRLTTNGRDSFPTWSPDGKQIAFLRPIGAAWRIYVMSSSGGKQRRLPKAPAAGRPTWSPHGLMIPSGGDLLKIDAVTGRVLKYFGNTIDAVWGMNTVSLAPDDSSLTYIGAAAPEPGDKECGEGPCQRFALYRENVLAKSKKARLIAKNVGPAAFSPDGKTLVFVAQNTKLRLWTLASGQSISLPLGTAYATAAAAPAWQP